MNFAISESKKNLFYLPNAAKSRLKGVIMNYELF